MTHLRLVEKSTPHHKPLKQYALQVFKDWRNVSSYAMPYLEAMLELDQIEDCYKLDRASSVVNYFLANASSWRGEVARQVKAELKQIIKNCDLELSFKNQDKAYKK